MLVAVPVAVAALLVVIAALLRDNEAIPLPEPTAPAYEGLPTPAELVAVDLPRSSPGYDPASVEATLDAVRGAYTQLYMAAPPEARRRAAERVALERGGARPVLAPDVGRAAGETGAGVEGGSTEPSSALGDEPAAGHDEGALRAEAALAALELADERLGHDAPPARPGEPQP